MQSEAETIPDERHQQVKVPLLRNSLFNSLSWGGNALVTLAATPLMVHYLGIEGYGVFALLTGLFGYFGILDLGFSDGLVKYVAHFAGVEDRTSLTKSINAALAVQSLAGSIGVAFLWAFNPEIVRLLKISPAMFQEASLCLYISAVGFFVTMLIGTFSSTLKGLQRFDILAKLSLVFSFLTTITSLVVLFLGGKLLGVMLATFLLSALHFGFCLYFVRRLLPEYKPALKLEREFLVRLFSFGSSVLVLRLSSFLNVYFVRIIIAILLGPAAVTCYVVPMRLISAIESGLNSVASVLFPFVSDLFAKGKTEYTQRLYVQGSKYAVAISTPLFFFVILFSRQILTVWMGEEFAEKAWLVQTLLGCASLLAVWTMVPANVALGIGRVRVIAAFAAIVAAMNLIFVAWLTAWYGVSGTAAAVLSTAFQGPIFIWYVTKRIVAVEWKEYFAKVFGVHVIPLTIMMFGAWLIIGVAVSQRASSNVATLVAGGILVLSYYWLLIKRGVISWAELGFSIGRPARVVEVERSPW